MSKNLQKFQKMKFFIGVLLIGLAPATNSQAIGPDFGEIKDTIESNHTRNKEDIQGKIKGEIQKMVSGMPEDVLARQSKEKVIMPTIDQAVEVALQAAREEASALIDREFHQNGKVLRVPGDHATIQEAIEAATSGDTVLVGPGTYYEQLVMKDGVKLVSDSTDQGDELTTVPGARLQLPKRALRTIVDGSRATASKHGMIDFNPGVTRKTIIDGFTFCNLPHQNHHIPGHAHGLNVRGASPVIMNCLVQNMGSTGIGNHVVYKDQGEPMESRDFRYANIAHFASALIYNNIITDSVGLGIGCNHFSTPTILGNEIFNNSDAELSEQPAPGIGNKHGSAATIIGNIVHGNPGGGILGQVGEPQGKHNVDRLTHPTIINNVVYDNGEKRPGIAGKGIGTAETPVIIRGNYVYNAGATGVALSNGAVGIIEDNRVSGSHDPGVAVNGATALKLNRNQVTEVNGNPGIIMVDGAVVLEMVGNAVDPAKNAPPYLLDGDSTIKTGR